MDIASLYETYLRSRTVSTDTRSITPGSVFFALRGENFNANKFAKEALDKGAVCAVIDDQSYAVDERCVVVADVLATLQELAAHHRNQLTIPVVGLTGSNGKTTTKEILSIVLSTKFKTHSTRGNLNNHIGVPLTILQIDDSVEMAVIEMGANHLGEIATLCAIANPTHGLITNIGRAHIGTFGGFENIIRGKSELYQHLITNGGQVFINSNDEVLLNMSKRFSQPLFYPGKDDYYHCELLSSDPYLIIRTHDGSVVETQLIGQYNFENVAAALCVGKYFEVDSGKANEAIREYVPGNMRSQVIRKGTNTIILDAYNANPSSMAAAIENLSSMNGDKKVVILGDMFELEDDAEKEHRAIGKLLSGKKFASALLCGELMADAAKEFKASGHFASREELINYLKENPINNAVVLVKASRGMQLEKVLDFI